LDAIQPPLPSGIGNVIMDRFGLPPSRQIGELKDALEAAIDGGSLEPRREAEYYLAHVASLLGREPPPDPMAPPPPLPEEAAPDAADDGKDDEEVDPGRGGESCC